MSFQELAVGGVFNFWNRDENHRIQVYREHNCIHIRMFAFNGLRRAWECADTFGEAKKIISGLKKTMFWKERGRAFR